MKNCYAHPEQFQKSTSESTQKRNSLWRGFTYTLTLLICLLGVSNAEAQTLFGAVSNGGANGRGTVITLDVNTSQVQVVYNFSSNNVDGSSPHSRLVGGGNGKMYGATVSGGSTGSGTVYSIDTNNNNAFQKVFDLTTSFNLYGSLF